MRHPEGRILYIHASDDDDVRSLKLAIRNIVGIRINDQRLTFNNLVLESGNPISAYNIPAGQVIVLTMRLRGAGKAVKKQAVSDRKAAMNHRYYQALQRALAVANNRSDDNSIFEKVMARMVDINAKLQLGDPIIKPMLAALTDPEAVKEIQSIMLSGTGGGGGNLPEARASKLAKFFVGECYVEALAQRERYDLLLESMQTMSVSMFAAEFYSDAKDTYQVAEFRKLLEEKLLILNHIALHNVIQGVSELSIGSSAPMQD